MIDPTTASFASDYTITSYDGGETRTWDFTSDAHEIEVYHRDDWDAQPMHITVKVGTTRFHSECDPYDMVDFEKTVASLILESIAGL